MSLALTACLTTGSVETRPPEPIVVGPSFCKHYKPVRWSKNDTRESQEQNVENNKVYKDLCLKK